MKIKRYKYNSIDSFRRNNKWFDSTMYIIAHLIPLLIIFALINWFYNNYSLSFYNPIKVSVNFRSPITLELRQHQYEKQIQFYEQYGPYLDEDYIVPSPEPTPTVAEPTPTPEVGLKLEDLQSFSVPDYIKELVLVFAEKADVPPAFAMGILLTENRSFNANSVNTNYDGSQDHGLWQLNGIPEYDPMANTERAADILNSKRSHLYSMGFANPSLGLLAESYNKGAAGALSLTYDPAGYARKVLQNATMSYTDDPFADNPFAYVQGL